MAQQVNYVFVRERSGCKEEMGLKSRPQGSPFSLLASGGFRFSLADLPPSPNLLSSFSKLIGNSRIRLQE